MRNRTNVIYAEKTFVRTTSCIDTLEFIVESKLTHVKCAVNVFVTVATVKNT